MLALLFSCTILLTTSTTLGSSKTFLGHVSKTRNPSSTPSLTNISNSVTQNAYYPTKVEQIIDEDGSDIFESSELNSIIRLFNHTYYYGEWKNIEGGTVPGFANRHGYTYLHYDAASNFPLDLHIYDGDYIDGKIMTLLYHDLRQDAIYDSPTKTLTLTNVAVTRQIGRIYGNYDPPALCPMNVTAQFLNLNNSQPYDLSAGADQLAIQFTFESNVCPNDLMTSIMTRNDKLFDSQVLPYVITVSVITILQCILLHLFHKHLDKQHSLARRTSAWTIVTLNGFDLYFFLSVSYFFMSYSPVFELSSIPIAVLAFCFEPKVIWKILQHQRLPNESNRPAAEVRTYFCMLSLFLCVLASLVVFPDFSYLLSAVYLAPQIRHNFIDSQKHRWNFWIIGGLGVPKLLFMAYTKIDPNNLFRISPNYDIAIIIIGLLLFQGVVLTIQKKWPRFGFEKKSDYLIYNKSRIIESQQDLCAICLDKLKDSFGSSSPGPSFIGTDTTLQDRRKIRTPCHHEFHLVCLRQWLESKLECPYCRKNLPLLPEEYIEE